MLSNSTSNIQAPPARLSKPGGRGTLAALCCAALFLFAVYLGAIGIFLPVLGQAFHLGPAVQGRIFPANFGGFIVGVLACGFLSDRIGRKRVLLGAILLFALAQGLVGFSRSFGSVLVGFALIGAGGGAMETVASALAADLFPQRRAAIINALQVAFGAGAALSPLLAHKLLIAGADWHRLFFAVALVNIFLMLLLAFQTVPATPHRPEALKAATLHTVLKHPAFLILCLCQVLYVGAETGFSSWLPSYFDRMPGGVAWTGIVVTGFWAAMTLGRAVVGGGIARVPLTRLAGGLALLGAVASGLTLLPHQASFAFIGVLGTGLFFSGIFGLILAEAGNRFPHSAGTVFGCVVAAGGIGGAVVPWAIGALTGSAWGWSGALALVPASAFLLGVILLIFDRSSGRAHH